MSPGSSCGDSGVAGTYTTIPEENYDKFDKRAGESNSGGVTGDLQGLPGRQQSEWYPLTCGCNKMHSPWWTILARFVPASFPPSLKFVGHME